MKRIITTAFLVLGMCLMVNTTTYAQDSDFSAGVGLIYGSGVYDVDTDLQNDIGIKVDAYYQFTEEIRAGVDFGYFFPKEVDFTNPITGATSTQESSVWGLSFNGHYFFSQSEEFGLYGLAGLNITNVSLDPGESTSEIGPLVGAGAEYALGFGDLFGEIKYNISGDADQLVIGAGVRFGF